MDPEEHNSEAAANNQEQQAQIQFIPDSAVAVVQQYADTMYRQKLLELPQHPVAPLPQPQ